MRLDLSNWNPFKFVRRHSGRTSDEATSRSRQQYQQQQQQLRERQQQQQQGQSSPGGAQQMGGGVPATWMDRGGMPDPMRMMATMLRDPFGSLAQLDRWFGDFSPAAFEPDIDVVDDGDAIRIVAELPGVDKNDVQIMLEDDYLVIGGEKKLERRAEERGAYRVERAFGSFQRVIPLPDGVDVERAEARFDNGTLTIRLPKVEAAQSSGRRLNITSGSETPPQQGTGSSAGKPQQG